MLVTNHVLSGAVIGMLVRSPPVAFPLAVASHFALDATPHWGRWGDERRFLRVAVADGLTGLAVMAVVGAACPAERRAAVVTGMAGAALPDLNKPSRLFFGRSPFPPRVDAFHRRIQKEAPDRFYSHEVTAGVLFAAAFTLLVVRRRTRP